MKINELVNSKFYEIIDFFGKNYTFQDYYFSGKNRPGLINENRLNHSFGANFYDILPSASSGEESETNKEDGSITNQPTIYEVAETMTDPSTIQIENLSMIPNNIYPALAFYLEISHISASELKENILEISLFKRKNYIPEFEEIKIIQTSPKSCIGYVVPSDISDTQNIFNHFNNNNKQIKVKYCYDILNMNNSKWYGVILRNIPENFNVKAVMDHFDLTFDRALYSQKIRDSYCTIVITSTLEESENICLKFHKNLDFIKANLHPKCCKLHSSFEKTIFKNFYNNLKFNVKKEKSKLSGISATTNQKDCRKSSNMNDFLIERISKVEDPNNSTFLSKKRIITETINLI